MNIGSKSGGSDWRRELLAGATAFMLIAGGGGVCLAWLVGDTALVKLRADGAPMKFNAALGFIALGLSAALLLKNKRCAALVCALFATAVGALTLAQDLIQIDLGIDQLFVNAFLIEPGATPGRMAPITAVLCTLSGIGFVTLGIRPSGSSSTFVGLLASIIAGLSATSLIGYATKTPIAYGWGASAGIAVHAAGGFVVAAVALGALSIRNEEKFFPRWLPWAALISGLACTASLGAVLFHEFSDVPTSRVPELTIAIGATMSVLMAAALHSRRALAGALEHSTSSEILMRSILEAAPDAMLIVDAAGCIVLANDMAERQFGYSRTELIGCNIERLIPEESPHRHAGYSETFAAGHGEAITRQGRELQAWRRDGSRFDVEIAFSPVMLPERNLVVAAVRDITLRRQTEQRLRESLEEKELLLKEIHHRVKNNLQVVASMLALQAAKTDEPAVQEPLEDCRQRVMSMALVHEKLYGATDLRRIDLSELAREITTLLISEGIGPRITTKFAVEPIVIDIERAVPASLIMNELISNALKHAFKGRSQGLLRVSVRHCEQGRACIEVADDGVGGVHTDSFLNARTLGMTIVRNLIRQLDAKLSVGAGPGTVVAISFPIAGMKSK
ncbi:sensor histidine kinase [Steroidobacter denitrificans]|uniref:sensor histidine kinase n=1 Tax=Steroidobacter denitrificans TaxID=465721 RepID=UPI00143B973F|nr:histidine kinase dimerization/phosphoacceptor domain -containing protein [Steroidobacter denitrificans]